MSHLGGCFEWEKRLPITPQGGVPLPNALFPLKSSSSRSSVHHASQLHVVTGSKYFDDVQVAATVLL